MRGLHKTIMAFAFMLVGLFTLWGTASSAQAVSYTYVGSWTLGDGPVWTTNPPVYSGQQAAAFLFGGSASDYAISTVSNLVADINFSAWVDGWGDSFTYASSGNPASQSFSLDTGGSGYNSNPGYQSAYSAYVADHFNPAIGLQDPSLVNYAFRISNTPIPAALPLFVSALGGLGFVAWRRRQANAA